MLKVYILTVPINFQNTVYDLVRAHAIFLSGDGGHQSRGRLKKHAMLDEKIKKFLAVSTESCSCLFLSFSLSLFLSVYSGNVFAWHEEKEVYLKMWMLFFLWKGLEYLICMT